MFKLYHCSTNVIERRGMDCARGENYFHTYLFVFFYSSIDITVDDEVVRCPPGTAILWEPEKKQFWSSPDNRVNHSFFDFDCDEPDFFRQIKLPLNTPIVPRMTGAISTFLDVLQNEFDQDNFLKTHKIDALLMNLFVDLSRKVSSSLPPFQTVIKNIAAEFERERTLMYEDPTRYDLNSYCKKLGFSPSRACYYYKKFFGTTPACDINAAKIHYLKTYLKASTTLRDVCSMLGFQDAAYASRWFSSNFGISFSEYKATLSK